jgi:hypothetical protein
MLGARIPQPLGLFAPALAARMLEFRITGIWFLACLYDCTNKLALSTKTNVAEPPIPEWPLIGMW